MIKNRKEAVSYGVFMEAIHSISAEGQTPSVRILRSMIGGSNSTLLEYFRRWRSEMSSPSLTDDSFSTEIANLSESFKQSVRAAMGRATRAACQSLEDQLTEEKKQAEEARNLLEETETHLGKLEAQYQLDQEQAAQKVLCFEKQLAARDEQVAELRRQIEKLETRFQEATKLAHETEIRAAIAESRVADLKKDVFASLT
jgi:DNA repair exonuclease SbcCD ATPase subunit